MNSEYVVQSKVFKEELRWVGEHWLCVLKDSSSSEETARISLYNTYESPSGEGVVAYVSICSGSCAPLLGVFTDNRNLSSWIHKAWSGGRERVFHQPLVVYDAQFMRGEYSRENRSWLIENISIKIEATWKNFEAPVVSYRGDDANVYAQRSLFNVLLFACDAEVQLNGTRVEGSPYLHNQWKSVIGGNDRSSCVIALAETFITPNRNIHIN
jgi:hypothetical protein